MKIKDEKIVDISMGISKESSFKLNQDSGILYDILRSKMYKDPISSIVREIASNSRDANREAGKGDVPIKVFFENTNEQTNYLFDSDSTTINFQDNGLGMAPDRIEKIYLTYGESDKRGTDGLTGGWGLGAKTPFAHADAFSVITVCDYEGKRMKYTYIASIDSTNKGKFSLMDEEETKEDTGTLISMPIEKGYVNDFKKACDFYFKHWDIKIEGFDKKEILNEYDNFNIYSINDESKVFLLIDNIYYPLMEHDDIKVDEFFSNLGVKLKIGLKFKTGEIPVQPSREDIRYTKEAIETINNRLENLDLSEILTDIFKDITCEDRKSFKPRQLNKNKKYITDKKLFYIIDKLYPKYMERSKYNEENDDSKVIPNFFTYGHRKNDFFRCSVYLSDLIDLVGENNTLYVLSPNEENFKYKRNKLLLLKTLKPKHLFLNDLNEKHRNDNSIVNEVIEILNLFSDVKHDYEIDYTPVRQVNERTNLASTVSYRYLSTGTMFNPKTIKKDADLNNAVLVDVENLKDFDANYSNSEKVKLLRYISSNSTDNFIFISSRYFKHFGANVKFDDYCKTGKYIKHKAKYEDGRNKFAIVQALKMTLNNFTAYLFYSEVTKLFPDLLVAKDKIDIKSSYYNNTDNFLKTYKESEEMNDQVYHKTRDTLSRIKDEYQISKVLHNSNFRSVVSKKMLDELETMKHGKEIQTNMHTLNRIDKLRGRKIKFKKIGLPGRLRASCSVSTG